MDDRSVLAQLDELRRAVDIQRAEIERLRAALDRGPKGADTTSRRAVLRCAGLTAAGAVGGGVLLGAAPPAAASTTVDSNLVVRGSSSPGTASEIGDGTNALTAFGRPGAVELGSRSGAPLLLAAQARWESDDDHVGRSGLDINTPAVVLRQTAEDHKGAMVECQQQLQAGPHVAGVATNAPGTRFDVATAGAKRVAWIVAHYGSPNTADGIHQHISIETCTADLQTLITRLQVSWGEDVALVSFPNSNVRVIQSDKVLGFGGGNQVRATYRSDLGKLAFSGQPVTFGRGQLQVADAPVAPTLFAQTTASRSRSDTSDLADDPELHLGVAAGATYALTAFVVYRAHVDADLRVAWTVPPGSTIRWTPSSPAAVTTGIVGPTKGSANGTEPVNVGGAGTGVAMAFAATGLLRTGEAGELRFRWAQGHAHVSATTIDADSYLQLTRVR